MRDNLNQVREGMDVLDRNGDKIGSVGHIYNLPANPASGANQAQRTLSGTLPGNVGPAGGVIEVDTGLLGLGNHLFIPENAIATVTGQAVCLGIDKDDLKRSGWNERPSWLANT